ncbi:MAG: hypothetical protein QW201_00460 [Thermoproteota archaeon]
MSRFRTTIIGSLPEFKHTKLEDKIKAAIDFQVKAGIDIISDGEQRSDMITYLASDLPGLELVDGKARVSRSIRAPEDPEQVGKVRDLITAKDYIKERGYNVGLKVSLTGPVTLGFTCALAGSGPYKGLSDEQLYRDLSTSLRTILGCLAKEDVMIQLDEPGLSAGFLRPSIAVPHIERAVEGIGPHRISLHVCGRLREDLFKHLLSIKGVTVLSLEFGGATENISLLRGLTQENKLFGVGCIKVRALKIDDVDSIDRVVNILRQVIDKIGTKCVKFVHPDCGLRNLDHDVAWKILNNMVEANKLL